MPGNLGDTGSNFQCRCQALPGAKRARAAISSRSRLHVSRSPHAAAPAPAPAQHARTGDKESGDEKGREGQKGEAGIVQQLDEAFRNGRVRHAHGSVAAASLSTLVTLLQCAM